MESAGPWWNLFHSAMSGRWPVRSFMCKIAFGMSMHPATAKAVLLLVYALPIKHNDESKQLGSPQVAHVQVAQRLQQAHQAGKAAAWTDCKVVVARVEGDLAAAHQAIQQERAARERLEQEMKRAFMRGVCALNIEVRLGAMGLDACCVRDAWHRDITGLAGHL